MQSYKNYIFDMDGVLWRGMQPMDKLPELMALLRDRGIGYTFATNNASKTPEQYVKKLGDMGVPVEAWQILSAATVTATYLKQNFALDKKVYIVGGDGLHIGIRAQGFEVVNVQGQFGDIVQPSDVGKGLLNSAEIVVVGFTPQVTYADLAGATYHINRGATFIGSNPDSSFPSEIGRLPGAGALIAAVQVATGKTATIIGKPERYIFEEAIRRMNGEPTTTLMVGDRLNTDVAGAHITGLDTLLVLSGIATSEEAERAAIKPTYIRQNIAELYAELLSVTN